MDKIVGDSGSDRLNGRHGRFRDLLNGGPGRDIATKDAGDVLKAMP